MSEERTKEIKGMLIAIKTISEPKKTKGRKQRGNHKQTSKQTTVFTPLNDAAESTHAIPVAKSCTILLAVDLIFFVAAKRRSVLIPSFGSLRLCFRFVEIQKDSIRIHSSRQRLSWLARQESVGGRRPTAVVQLQSSAGR